jgi:protein Tob/BTG
MSALSTTTLSSTEQSTSKSQLISAVDAAVWWWGDFMRKSSLSLDAVKKFEEVLRDLIVTKISAHWYPDNPAKGQAFRSVSIDKKARIDPLLSRSATSVGIDNLLAYFTKVDSVLMWIDPDVVIVRVAYSGYTNIPPEDKVLHRSNIGSSPKIVSSKPLKTVTPPPIARPGILRTSPLASPSSPSNNNSSFLGSYRSSSPGLNSNAAQYFPSSIHFTHPAPPSPSQYKPAYIPAQRPMLYNNLFNQSQYISWQHSQYSENWNNENNQLPTQAHPQPQANSQQNGNRNKLYIDYIDSVLPLEAQA